MNLHRKVRDSNSYASNNKLSRFIEENGCFVETFAKEEVISHSLFSCVTTTAMTAMTMTKLIQPRKFEIQYKEDRNFKNENVWIISETKLKTKKFKLISVTFSTFFQLKFRVNSLSK